MVFTTNFNRRRFNNYRRRRTNIPFRYRKYVKRQAYRTVLTNQEKKFIDTPVATTVSTSGTVIKLTGIAQGDSDSTRDGDKARLVMVKWRFNVLIDPDFAALGGPVRFILFQYHLDDGITAPTLGAILQNSDVNSMYNHDNGSRFSIIADRVTNVSTVGNTSVNQTGSIVFNNRRKMRYIRRNMKFTATTNGMEMLYLIIISTAAAELPTVTGYARVIYTDS